MVMNHFELLYPFIEPNRIVPFGLVAEWFVSWFISRPFVSVGVVGTLDLGEDGIVGLDSLGLVGDDWLLDDLGCWNLDGLGDLLLDDVLISGGVGGDAGDGGDTAVGVDVGVAAIMGVGVVSLGSRGGVVALLVVGLSVSVSLSVVLLSVSVGLLASISAEVGAGVGRGRVVDVGGSTDGGDGWDVLTGFHAIARVVGVDLNLLDGLGDLLLLSGWDLNIDVRFLSNLDVVNFWDELFDELGVGVAIAVSLAVSITVPVGGNGSSEEGSNEEFHFLFEFTVA